MPLYQFDKYRFDSQKGCLYPLTSEQAPATPLQEIPLRHKVASLLSYLLEHRSQIVSKEELLAALWQHSDYRENALTQSIRELRKALGDKAQQPIFIRTYPQRGYQWVCPVADVDSDLAQENISTEVAQSLSSLGKKQVEKELIKAETEVRKSAEEEALSEQTAQALPNNKTHKSIRWTLASLVLIVLFGTTFWFNYGSFVSTSLNENSAIQIEKNTERRSGDLATAEEAPSLLVLPFINSTDIKSMAWLELGLSDMLATELQRRYNLSLVPPASSQHLLLSSELSWPALPVQIRALLNKEQLSAALFASVRLHKEQQVLDFQLIYADGRTQQGSIRYPSLPASVSSIAQQLLYLLQPAQKALMASAPETNTDPVASQALAEGIQYLQTQGAFQALRYFQASQLVEPENHWASVRMAQSQLLLGHWSEAEHRLKQIPTQAREQDLRLNAFIDYWLAELAFRRHSPNEEQKIDLAIKSAESANSSTQMALSYRLQARYAWREMQWQNHQAWLTKADQLNASNSELQTQAENLFYLGNPTNEGLEKSPLNDLRQNQKRLLKALNFYQQLHNQPMVAATQLAIAQNYSLPLEQRQQALEQSIALYRQLQQPYELAQALIYAGFYQMQLHQGQIAYGYFSEAERLTQQLGAHHLLSYSHFYQAFSLLDQGLDQNAIGGHGQDPQKLHQAITQLKQFIAEDPAPLLKASSLIFLGWAYSDLKEYDTALSYLEHAKQLNQTFSMPTTAGYANYSIMRIHLARNDYSAVIAMENEPITTRLQASYLARAWYEIGQPTQAVRVLQEFHQQLPELWQEEDSQRLTQYMTAQSGQALMLHPEPLAHLVYCESDWLM